MESSRIDVPIVPVPLNTLDMATCVSAPRTPVHSRISPTCLCSAVTFPPSTTAPTAVRFNLLIHVTCCAYSALHARMLHKSQPSSKKASNPRYPIEGYRMRRLKELLDCAPLGGVLVSAMRMRASESLTAGRGDITAAHMVRFTQIRWSM